MPFDDIYHRQVSLLVPMLPYVAIEDCFALKGGMAINLFVRDMPRLSVDIDLTYVPVKSREESLEEIEASLKHIADMAGSRSPAEDVTLGSPNKEGAITHIIARGNDAQVRIEVTPVIRGCVFEPESRAVTPRVEEAFAFAEMKVVSFADLYGGKIVAALDRQHPRDLFDVRDLLANEGIDENLRRAFIVYLLSHDRPMHEVVAPHRKDISQAYEREFDGMADPPVALEELVGTREDMIVEVIGNMPDSHRQFLISFERGEPKWELLDLQHVPELPAVLWRQLNLDKVDAEARAELVWKLEQALGC